MPLKVLKVLKVLGPWRINTFNTFNAFISTTSFKINLPKKNYQVQQVHNMT
jgi:hypothetical protein